MQENDIGLKKIAERLDLSVSTVSRALRGSELVNSKTKSRVLEEARSLGYSFSEHKEMKPKFLGVYLPYRPEHDLMDTFFFEVIRGIQARISGNGSWQIVLCDSSNLSDSVLETLDGMIVLDSKETEEVVNPSIVPTLVLNSMYPSESVLAVITDEIMGARMLTEHLLIHGHKDIAFVGKNLSFSALNRVKGFEIAMTESGLTINPELIIEFDTSTSEEGYKSCAKLFNGTTKPSAIIAYNDLIAIGIMRWITEHGLSFPDDVSVAGFEGTPLIDRMGFNLTTVDLQGYEQGYTAATMLLTQSAGGIGTTRHVRIIPKLKVGRTTGWLLSLADKMKGK